MKFKVGDRVRVIHGGGYYCDPLNYTIQHMRNHSFTSEKRIGEETIIEDIKYSDINGMNFFNVGFGNWWSENSFELVESINSSNKSIMSTIKEFAKNLVLSKKEKLLRKHGLKDSCGEFTADAKELALIKLAQDNQDYLVSLAEAKEKEENNK